ncbi:MAG: pre-peptidase C-terminal domain-containing protein [Candidatus Wallbacteria bacterium]|nr:pre-peptidase C-terminal domain-containing protein [Candidatus Wallbacteria bacterium]
MTCRHLRLGLAPWFFALAAAGASMAQESTALLTVAGIVKNSSGSGLNGFTVRVRNSSTERSAQTITPSASGAQAGLYVLELFDLGGNRAVATGDILRFSVFDGSGNEVSSATPSRAVTTGDLALGLCRLDHVVDTSVVTDTVPPSCALTYSAADTAQIMPGSALVLTATFSEDIAAAAPTEIRLRGPLGQAAGAAPVALAVTRVTGRVYSVMVTVPNTSGLFLAEVSGARDTAGNQNLPPANSVFRSSAPAAPHPAFALGDASAASGAVAVLPVGFIGAAIGPVSSVQFRTAFDSAKLRFEGADLTGLALEAGYSVVAREAATGVVDVALLPDVDSRLGNGPPVQLRYSVLASGPTGGQIPVATSELAAVGPDAILLSGATISSGAVVIAKSRDGEVGTQICFDVNGSGTFSASDIQVLINRMRGRSGFLQCADGTQDCFDTRIDGVPAQAADLQFLINHSLALVDAQTCSLHSSQPVAGTSAQLAFPTSVPLELGAETVVSLGLTYEGGSTNASVSALAFSVSPSAVVTVVSVSAGAALNMTLKSLQSSITATGLVRVVVSGGNGTIAAGELAQVRIRSVLPGSGSLGLSELDGANAAAEPLAGLTASAATVDVDADPSVAILGGALGTGIVGVSYAAGFVATGTAPVAVSISPAGGLPPGVSFDPGRLVLAGTPTAAGAFPFQVVSTGPGGTAAQLYMLTVVDPAPLAVAIGSAVALRGGMVKIPVTLRDTSAPRTETLQFRIRYPGAELGKPTVAIGAAAAAAGKSVTYNATTTGSVIVMLSGPDGPQAISNGVLVSLDFPVLPGTGPGRALLSGSGLDVVDADSNSLAGAITDGVVVLVDEPPVDPSACFDINGDSNSATASDIQRLINRLLGKPNFQACLGGGQGCFDVRVDGVPAQAADLQYLLNRAIAKTGFMTCVRHTNEPQAVTPSTILVPEGARVQSGATGTVQLVLSQPPGTPATLSALSFSVRPSRQLTCVSAVIGAAASAAGKSIATQLTSMGMNLVVHGTNDLAFGGGELATLTVKGVAAGTGSLTVERIDAADSSANSLSGIAGSTASVTVLAGSAPTVTLGRGAVAAGGAIDVPVQFDNVTGTAVGGLQLDIEFDSTVLSITGVRAGAALLGSGYQVASALQAPGRMRVVVFGLDASALPSGNILLLKVEASQTALQGTVRGLVGSGFSVSDTAGNEVQATLLDGSIEIAPSAAREDLNSDGYVDVRDGRIVANVMLGRSAMTLSADLTDDAKVNIFDILRLANAVVSRPTEAPPGLQGTGADEVVEVGTARGAPGGELEVPLVVGARVAGRITEFQCDVTFPSADLSFVGFRPAKALAAAGKSVVTTGLVPGGARVYVAPVNLGVLPSGEAGKLVFRVSTSATQGARLELGIGSVVFTDVDGVRVGGGGAAGFICVTADSTLPAVSLSFSQNPVTSGHLLQLTATFSEPMLVSGTTTPIARCADPVFPVPVVSISGANSSFQVIDEPMIGSGTVFGFSRALSPTAEQNGDYVVTVRGEDLAGLAVAAPASLVIRIGNRPPVANAGLDASVPQGSSVLLDGRRSSDPDGSEVSFQWTQPGEPTVQLDNASAPQPSFVATSPGIYTFRLVVSDGTLESAGDEVVVTVVSPTGDDHANDAGSVTASDFIGVDGPEVEGAIEKAGDVDFFVIEAKGGEKLTIRTRLLTITDTVLALFSESAPTVPVADNDDAAPGDRSSKIEFTPSVSGVFFVRVRHFSRFSGAGRYALSVTAMAGPAPIADDHPNAAELTLAPRDALLAGEASAAGEIETTGDVDYFFFDAKSTESYTLEVQLGTMRDSFMTLLDRDGSTVLAANDDFGNSAASKLADFQPTIGGTYFVQIRHFSRAGTGEYRLSLSASNTSAGATADDHPGRPEATVSPADDLGALPVTAAIEPAGDVDIFRLAAKAGLSYDITATSVTAGGLDLSVLDRDGRVPVDVGSKVSGALARVTGFRPVLAGTYFVVVRSTAAALTGTYRLEATANSVAGEAARLAMRVTTAPDSIVATLLTSQSSPGLDFVLASVAFDAASLELLEVQTGTALSGASLRQFDFQSGFLGLTAHAGEGAARIGDGAVATLRFGLRAGAALLPGLVALTSAEVGSRRGRSRTLGPRADAGPERQLSVAGGSAEIVDPELGGARGVVRLDGRRSADSNVPPLELRYAWVVVSAPAPTSLSSPTSAVVTFAPGPPGTYVFGLTVRNGLLESPLASTRVTINRLNRTPSAQAFAIVTSTGQAVGPGDPVLEVTTGTDILLDGRFSVDEDREDAGRLAYRWMQLAGPGVLTTALTTVAAPRLVVTSPGAYEFHLVVLDPAGAQSPPFRTGFLAIERGNKRPRVSLVASATSTSSTGEDLSDQPGASNPRTLRVVLPSRVTLKAEVDDSDVGRPPLKQLLSFSWKQEDGPPVQLSTSTFAPADQTVSAVSFEPTVSRLLGFRCEVSEFDSTGRPTGVKVSRKIRVIVDDVEGRTPEAKAVAKKKQVPAPKSGAAPVADAEESFGPGDVVELVGSASARALEPDKTLSYTWVQIEGPRVTLSQPFAQITTFVVPDTRDAGTRNYVFALLASDGERLSEPFPVRLRVRPPESIERDLPAMGGLAMVSLPVDPSTTGHPFDAADFLTSTTGSVVVQLERDPESGRGRFGLYAPGLGNQAFVAQAGRGLLVLRPPRLQRATRKLRGLPWRRESLKQKLHPGLNLIGYPLGVPTDETVASLLTRTGGTYAIRVGANGRFEVYFDKSGVPAWKIQDGEAYIVFVPAERPAELPSGN